MPVKPENKHRYPADWPAIRRAAGERAQWKCQHPGCLACQYDVGIWLVQPINRANWQCLAKAETYREARQSAAEASWTLYGDGPGVPRVIVIVLTCAHLDHQPENCDPANLRMFCQRHHLAHDQAHHLATAYATRRARSATPDMFAAQP